MKKNFALHHLILLLVLTVCGRANASNYYWVGGSGVWSDYANHWATTSGGSTFQTQAPTSADNVYFDANSFTSSNQIVTIDNGIIAACNNMDWTGATNNPSISGVPAELDIYGSLTLIAAMSASLSCPVTFMSTSPGQTITSAGQQGFGDDPTSFNGVGGSWTLQDSLILTHSLYILNGTLNTNNKTVSITNFSVTQGGTAHTLTLGSSVVNVSGQWSGNDAGFVLNAGTSTINMTADNANFNANSGTAITYYNVNFTGNGGATFNGGYNTFYNVSFSAGATIQGSNTFNNLIFNATGTSTYTLQAGRTQTINGAFTVNGTCTSGILLTSDNTSTSTISIPTGTATISYATLSWITATGSGAPFTAVNSVDGGNNSGFTITSAVADLYWIGGTGNWSDGTHWSLTSGGAAYGCIPTSATNVHFDSNSFHGGNVVTIDVTANCNDMIWSGTLKSPTLAAGGNTLNIYGSLTLAAGMTMTGGAVVQLLATTPGHTITTGGVFSGGLWFGTPAGGGTGGGWTLQDDLTINGTSNSNSIYLCNGTLNTNNYTVTSYTCHCDYGGTSITVNAGSSIFNLTEWRGNGSQLIFNGPLSTFNISGDPFGGANFDCNSEPNTNVYGNINFTDNSGQGISFTTCGCTYGNVTNVGDPFTLDGSNGNIFGDFDMHVAGSSINVGNTFNNLTLSSNGGYYSLAGGDTQKINGSIIVGSGSCASPLILASSSPGAIIYKTSGSVTLDYGALTWINATGGATFTDNNATDGGNNTGWILNTLTAPADLYWIGGTGDWSDGTHWSATSGGVSFGGCFPLATTNVHFDANSFINSSGTVTLDVAGNCNNMDWTGVLHGPTFNGGSNNLSINGSLTLAAGMLMTGSPAVQLVATTPGQTITTYGVFSGGLWFGTPSGGGIGGGWTLQDDLTINGSNNSNSVYFCNGTLNTNNFTITSSTCHSDYGGDSILVNAGSSVFNLTIGTGNGSQLHMNGPSTVFNISGNNGMNSFNCNSEPASNIFGDVNFTGSGAADFTGSGCTYRNITCPDGANTFTGNNTCNNVLFGGSSNISGSNTFNNLTLSPGTSSSNVYTLSAGKTQTINGSLNVVGNSNYLTEIISDNPGNASAFYKTSGSVCSDYLYLQDNSATGGATFNAGANSQDAGGNSGWVFSSSNPLSVSIAATPSSTLCRTGETITFTATPGSGLKNLVYEWKVNGSVAGNNSAIFSSNTFNSGDSVTVTITPNSGCTVGADTVTSAAINITPGSGGVAGTVSATPDTVCSGSPVNLSVAGSSGNIQWQSSTSPGNFTTISGATNTTYSDVPTQSTYYRVKAGTGACADSSNEFQITVAPVPTVSFTDVVSGKQVTFTSVSGATIYNWNFGDDSTSNQPNPVHHYTSNGTYQVCLEVSDGGNCSDSICHEVEVTATGIPAISKQENWQVYPEPFSDILFINSNQPGRNIKSMEIYDVLGRVVFQATPPSQNNPVQANLSGLTQGVYFLKITTGNSNYTQRIIKQ